MIPTQRKQRREDSWSSVASHLILFVKFKANEKTCLKKTKTKTKIHLKTNFWDVPLVSTHTCPLVAAEHSSCLLCHKYCDRNICT